MPVNIQMILRELKKGLAALSLENDVVISAKLASDTKYAESKMPFMINVRAEEIPV